jgi:hypothetical protein
VVLRDTTIVLVLVVPTSLPTTRMAHSTKSYVGQAVLVLDFGPWGVVSTVADDSE